MTDKTPMLPVHARQHVIDALRADLVGPFFSSGHAGAGIERLSLPLSRWYLTGFLAPEEGRDLEEIDKDDGMGAGDDEAEVGPAQEPEPKKKNLLSVVETS